MRTEHSLVTVETEHRVPVMVELNAPKAPPAERAPLGLGTDVVGTAVPPRALRPGHNDVELAEGGADETVKLTEIIESEVVATHAPAS